MRTKLFPMVQIKKGTWEIDEFEAASMFLLEGTEKAMLIDLGMGIGDIKGAVEMVTDKPLIVVITHNHPDHIGNIAQFNEVWMSHKDINNMPIPCPAEKRRLDTACIAQRQKGSIGAPYNMFNLYPYDIYEDIEDLPKNYTPPVIHDIYDGMRFDLGGGRVITAYECPGHTNGQMVFLDEQNKMLFCGDAINYTEGLAAVPVETSLKALKRIQAMGDKYDGIYNGHHDERPLGAPLDPDCLPCMIEALTDVLNGFVTKTQMPNAWGQDMPLTRYGSENEYKLREVPSFKGGNKATVVRGRVFVTVDLDKIHE